MNNDPGVCGATVTCTATDADKNSSSCTFTVTVNDVEPPPTVFVVTPPDPDNDPTPFFKWIGSDSNGCTAPANLLYSTNLDGAGWSTWSSSTSATLGPLGEGWHTFEVRAMDEYLNVSVDSTSWATDGYTKVESTASYTWLWLIDLTLPSVVLITPVDGGEYLLNSLVPADWDVNDALSGLASYDATTPDGSPIDTAMVGDKPFFVTATDLAGNTSRIDAVYRVVYEVTPGGAAGGGGGLDGGAPSFLDQAIAGGGGAVGEVELAAIYELGESIGISFTLTDDDGNPITDAMVSATLVRVTLTEDGEEHTVLELHLIPYDPELGLYSLFIETVTDERALELGYYDIWLGFDDGTQVQLRIEIVADSSE